MNRSDLVFQLSLNLEKARSNRDREWRSRLRSDDKPSKRFRVFIENLISLKQSQPIRDVPFFLHTHASISTQRAPKLLKTVNKALQIIVSRLSLEKTSFMHANSIYSRCERRSRTSRLICDQFISVGLLAFPFPYISGETFFLR